MTRCCCGHFKVIFKVFSNVAFQGWVALHNFLTCKVDSGNVFNSGFEVKHEGWVQSCIHQAGSKYLAEMVKL